MVHSQILLDIGMILIKKILKKIAVILTLFFIWYGLRWYFVIPRIKHLGDFEVNKSLIIKVFKKINYDQVLYFYDYGVLKNGKENIKKRFLVDYANYDFNDFSFLRKKENIYILHLNGSTERIDTLLILDNHGNEIRNDDEQKNIKF